MAKDFRKPTVMILLLASILTLLLCAKAIGEERYEPRLVLRLGWGSGDREVSPKEIWIPKWGPQSFAVDGEGNIYIADTANYRVLKFSGDGKLLLSFTTEDFSVDDIVVDDRSGNIYLLNDHNMIRVHNKNGDPLIEFDPDTHGYVVRLAIDGEGNLYIGDSGGKNSDKKLEVQPIVRGSIKALKVNRVSEGMKYCVNSKGNIYEAWFLKEREKPKLYSIFFYVYNRDGRLIRKIPIERSQVYEGWYDESKGGSWSGEFVGVDDEGNIYLHISVSDDNENNSFVYKFNRDGKYITHFKVFWGLLERRAVVDRKGNVYSVDMRYGSSFFDVWKYELKK